MKHLHRTVALVLTLVVVMAAFSTCAFAADSYRVETLKKGTWYKVPYYDNIKTVYKLVLSTDSIITVNRKGNNSGEAYVMFYTDKKCTGYGFNEDYSSGTDILVFAKGTYYIKMYDDWAEKPNTQVRITVQKAVNQNNYCRAKAVNLKRNKTVKIAQTANYCYDRWYKITLNSKKTVTITTNEEMADRIKLYDSRMQKIDCTSGSRKVISEDPIKKGTYFIRVMSPNDYDYVGEYTGTYLTLSWN